MRNGWTGGQYSVVRAILGVYLLVHFLHLAPWAAELFSSEGVVPRAGDSPLAFLLPNVLALVDAPAFATAFVLLGAALAVPFALGLRDRAAAVGLWYVWACLHGRNPLISNPGLPYVGWILLAHAFLPAAPFGSWQARGRADPSGGWHLPGGIFAAAWILMALGYSYSGFAKLGSPSWVEGTAVAHVLENPLARPTFLREALLSLPEPLLRAMTWGALAAEIGFAPLALFARLRPWLWLALLLMHFQLMALLDFTDLSLGMVMLHLFTFDPAWIPARREEGETLFYDGACGLCHGTVRFLLAEGPDATSPRFAPLGGETFAGAVPAATAAALPDSLVLRRADGTLLFRSAAVIRLLRGLGGAWRLAAAALSLVPTPLRDFAYDRVAAVRRRVFASPSAACPVAPPAMRARLLP